ncbi:PHP domain-containing protein [Infirmifilum sp. SLHALR2]
MSSRKRRYHDVFCGRIETPSREVLENLYMHAKEVGYYACIPSFCITPKLDTKTLQDAVVKLRSMIDDLQSVGYQVYLRCHFTGLGQVEMKKALPRIRGYCDLVSVEAISREIAAFSSRDRRVDIVTMQPLISPKLYKGDIEYILRYGKFVEVIASSLLAEDAQVLAKNISSIRSLLSNFSRKKVPVLISSGDKGLKDPRSLIAFAELVLNLDGMFVATSISKMIEQRLNENVEKRLGIRPVEGLRVEGKAG